MDRFRCAAVQYQLEVSAELATAEVGPMEALAALSPALEHVLELPYVVGRPDLVSHFEVGVDRVCDVAQKEAGTLLAFVLDVEAGRSR